MKVLLVDFDTVGHHVEYASYLSRYLVEAGDEVVYVTPIPDSRLDELREIGVTVEYIDPKNTYYEKMPHKVLAYFIAHFDMYDTIARHNPDVAHFMYLDASPLGLFISSKLYTIDSPMLGHLIAPRFAENYTSVLSNAYWRVNNAALSKLTEHWLHAVFVHSERLRDLVSTKLNVNSDQFISVPDPLEPVSNDLTAIDARRELGLPEDDELYLYFGDMRHHKGPDVLLEAITTLDDSDNSEKRAFVFAGSPGAIDSRDVSAIQSQTTNQTTVIGRFEFIEESLVDTYFIAADAIVLPYRDSYVSTSGILQHAAAANRPVIATRVGDIGPIMDRYDLGISTDPDDPDALARAIFEFSETNEHPSGIENYVEHHHWRNMAERVRNEYKSAINTVEKDGQ